MCMCCSASASTTTVPAAALSRTDPAILLAETSEGEDVSSETRARLSMPVLWMIAYGNNTVKSTCTPRDTHGISTRKTL